MSRWTGEELRELVALWPTNSAKQIAILMHRPRSAVCGKAKRLRAEGLLPHGGRPKHFDVNPRTLKQRVSPKPRITTLPPPPPAVGDRLDMQTCALHELDDSRCHWPLGDLYQIAALFCGAASVPGRHYCAHHAQMARRDGSAN
jgi:GcrA cell cycle regulator